MKKVIVAGGIALLSQQANAGLITINLEDQGGLTSSQTSLFEDAVDFWSSTLTGIQAGFDLIMTITARGDEIDGRDGVLGSAGPSQAYIDSYSGYAYTQQGSMVFDTADLSYMESNGTLYSVLLHEMAHVIGFGTMWNPSEYGAAFNGTQSVYQSGSGQYTGTYGLDAYRAEFDPDAMYIPVELDGGQGTANSHWDEYWAGGRSDLMTGYIEGATTLSNTTIASFADIGYLTSVTHSIDSIDVPAPTTMALFGIGVFGMCFRRKQK